jgi:hypothetical protein
MERTYFTEAEARIEIGNMVEALSDFPSVPKGSKGAVVKVKRYIDDKWVAVVAWDLPRPTSVIEAMVIDTSFNFLNRSKPITDQFCKSEYEMLVRTLQPVT